MTDVMNGHGFAGRNRAPPRRRSCTSRLIGSRLRQPRPAPAPGREGGRSPAVWWTVRDPLLVPEDDDLPRLRLTTSLEVDEVDTGGDAVPLGVAGVPGDAVPPGLLLAAKQRSNTSPRNVVAPRHTFRGLASLNTASM